MDTNLLGSCENAGSDSVGRGWGLRLCISTTLPGDLRAGLGPHLGGVSRSQEKEPEMLRGVTRPRVQTAVGWRRHPAASVLGGSNLETKKQGSSAHSMGWSPCAVPPRQQASAGDSWLLPLENTALHGRGV